MKGPVALIKEGARRFRSLLKNQDFGFAYLICFGIYDIAYAAYTTKHPDDLSGQFQLALTVGGNLGIFFGTLILLMLWRRKPVRSRSTLKEIWRVWKTNFISGLYIILGLLCFIIPGIVLAIRYLYINEAVVFEDCAIHPALRRSRELSKVNGGKLCWALSLLFIGYVAITTIAEVAVAAIYEPASSSFAFNFVVEVTGTALTALFVTTSYAGYLDAVGNDSAER